MSNQALAVMKSTAMSMTSREIAELTGKQHDNVLRDIRNLGSVLKVEETPYTHPQNGQQYIECRLSKRDCLILVSGYNADLRARIIDRWIELETAAAPTYNIPTTLSGALRLAAEQAETIELQSKQLEAAKPSIEFVGRYVESTGSKGFRQVCKLLGANESDFREFLLDKKIMYRLGGEWVPHAPHLDAGRFEIKTGTAEGTNHAFNQAKFTPKGVSWIAGEWAKYQLEVRDDLAKAAGDAA